MGRRPPAASSKAEATRDLADLADEPSLGSIWVASSIARLRPRPRPRRRKQFRPRQFAVDLPTSTMRRVELSLSSPKPEIRSTALPCRAYARDCGPPPWTSRGGFRPREQTRLARLRARAVGHRQSATLTTIVLPVKAYVGSARSAPRGSLVLMLMTFRHFLDVAGGRSKDTAGRPHRESKLDQSVDLAPSLRSYRIDSGQFPPRELPQTP